MYYKEGTLRGIEYATMCYVNHLADINSPRDQGWGQIRKICIFIFPAYLYLFVFEIFENDRICIYLYLAVIFEIFDQIHSNTGVFFSSTTELLYCSFSAML